MNEWQSHQADNQHAGGSDVPHDFIRITEHLHPGLDRKLGYFGNERFVTFCYSPRVDGVMWKDNSGYGFGSGAWCAFLDHVAPLTDDYEVNLGCGNAEGPHVLVLDRVLRQAYFADRDSADRLLSRKASDSPGL